jgi:hypothetical protein
MAADPSLLERQASNAIDLAILIPRLRSPADYRQMAADSGRLERGWR